MKKGDKLILSVTDLNNLGFGVGREQGRVVFVSGAVTGDLAEVSIIKVNKSYAIARLLNILEPSPYRAEDFCRAPQSCGGCTYRNVSYEHELLLKQNYVKNAFVKAGLPEVVVHPVIHTGKMLAYRNKGQYPVGMGKNGMFAGFFAAKTHRIIASDGCAIQNPAFAPIVLWICREAEKRGIRAYDEETGEGLLRHIYLRIGEVTGQIMVCLVINGERFPGGESFAKALAADFPAVTGVLLNHNVGNTNVVLGKSFTVLYGNDSIEDVLCGLRFRITADSFYQVNRDGAELLYAKAAELADLRGHEVLMDLYCGTGTIGLTMAKHAASLVGIEIVPAAVACAKVNAEQNHIANASFFCGDASDRDTILRCAGGVRPDVVVMDPPRKGSTPELIGTLASLEVPRVVYVSCDADTLARDVALFLGRGYTMGDVFPVDMFPRCGHVESVVCLSRK